MAGVSEILYSKIDTFVFFDLETTDLIRGSKMPKITELSMVATSRHHLRSDSRNKFALPRILNKLTIPICPMEPITPQASYFSNLWNDALEKFKPFDDSTYSLIMQFIDRLPGNICFVAHNGNRFDYPIFLSEVERIQKVLPDKILCVDSMDAFKEFFSDTEVIPQTVQIIPEGRDEVDEELERQKSNSSLEDDWDDALYDVLDNLDKDKKRDQFVRLHYENGTDVLDAVTNEPQNPDKSGLNPKSIQESNEKTPENQIIRNSSLNTVTPRKALEGVRKRLNFSSARPKNFKLATVHMHFIGCEPENQHCAEDDCISMLRCVCQIGSPFAEWADQNAISLNNLKKMN